MIAEGSRVVVRYIGTLDNGRIFDSTEEGQPLVFTMGRGEIFPALERAVAAMGVGETRSIVVPAADAYGPRLPENMLRLERARLPVGRDPRPGQRLSLEFGAAGSRVMVITEVGEEWVTLDGNHPLAGLDLTFALRVESVS